MTEPSARDVDALIADFEQSDLRELHVRSGEFELRLSRDREVAVSVGSPAPSTPAAAPTSPAAPAPAPAAPAAQSWPEDATVIVAPYLGTFYRSPKPGAPAFVEIGQPVTADTELCLVEVMKLFTSVRAGVDGIVHAVLASDGQLVEADQPLVVLTPA